MLVLVNLIYKILYVIFTTLHANLRYGVVKPNIYTTHTQTWSYTRIINMNMCKLYEIHRLIYNLYIRIDTLALAVYDNESVKCDQVNVSWVLFEYTHTYIHPVKNMYMHIFPKLIAGLFNVIWWPNLAVCLINIHINYMHWKEKVTILVQQLNWF